MVAAPPENLPAVNGESKSNLKAERRALQEAQKAAKASGSRTEKKAGRESVAEQSTSTLPPASQMPITPAHLASQIFNHLDAPRSAKKAAANDHLVHPAVTRLAIQWSEMKIVGANARCISMLTAFKQVVESYRSPDGAVLSRHLPQHLSPQIEHLYKARNRSLTLGNAIRYIKWEIAQIPLDMQEDDAKELLIERIDHFIRDRIVMADKVIQTHAISKIRNGDVVLTFGRSSIVQATLLQAKEDGKEFSVIVVDSRPLLEGKNLLKSLRNSGIPCTYALLSSLGAILSQHSISLVFLGTHALLSDGAMFSRAGTATVAMMCRQAGKPVVCLCETYKFSERVMLDSITGNEMANPALLLPLADTEQPGRLEGIGMQRQPFTSGDPHLAVFNLLYDVARPEDVSVVISEAGLLPVQSVPAILREFKPLEGN